MQRLAPSLAQYIGCTIIDVNPGIGLWSSKLHDYLKPRNHILMEPKKSVFLPFLQPLLDAPGSRYRIKHWPEKDIWHPDRYVEEGLLHDAEGHGGPPPTTAKPNNLILIIANLVGRRLTSVRSTMPTLLAHVKAIDLSHAVRHRSGFQKYGPTRVLMWLANEDKRALLPRTIGYRGKISIYIEENFELEEIVGFPHASDSKIRREEALDIESSKRVAKRMQEKDIQIPLERDVRPEDRNHGLWGISRPWHKDLQELEEDFRTGKFSKYTEGPVATPNDKHISGATSEKANSSTSMITPKYKKMRTLRSVAQGQNATMDRVKIVLEKQEKIDRMDFDLHREDIKPLEQEEIIKALDSSIQEYKNEMDALTVAQWKILLFLDDDRRAFAMEPPLLLWDRRKAEPILARKDDFYAQVSAALLDFQPKVTDELPMTSDQSIYFDMIATFLFGPRGQITLRHLKTIAPGAFEALVPQVPAIRDPRKGGRYDVDSMRARNATPEMIHGLAVAFDNWAFKPPIEDVLTQFGMNLEDGVNASKGNIVKL